MANGTSSCWGNFLSYALQVPDGVENSAIFLEPANTFTIDQSSGRVAGWGFQNFGATTIPESINPDASKSTPLVQSIAMSYTQACALKSGAVTCWYSHSGGLNDHPPDNVTTPTPLNGDVSAITAGYYHACALFSNSKVTCWGGDSPGYNASAKTVPSDLQPLISR